ncbi:hypothetical protein [Desulfovibrio sp. JC010]|uniref:hypothetical protein n=1 Tax=Desulfovibrio sp. JC010 TaxID=2593641 RepID=UPI0013D1677E|nr:hypothetical protein [Desulfovibrio sp. JC010]NDV27530.1 hypothetical protein [Desulfovibrio sp. JC010]
MKFFNIDDDLNAIMTPCADELCGIAGVNQMFKYKTTRLKARDLINQLILNTLILIDEGADAITLSRDKNY